MISRARGAKAATVAFDPIGEKLVNGSSDSVGGGEGVREDGGEKFQVKKQRKGRRLKDGNHQVEKKDTHARYNLLLC